MTHYVVMCDCAVDSMGYDETHVIAVKHSRDEARMALKEKSRYERQCAIEYGWKIYADTDDEFATGENGSYAVEHLHFYIEEVEG